MFFLHRCPISRSPILQKYYPCSTIKLDADASLTFFFYIVKDILTQKMWNPMAILYEKVGWETSSRATTSSASKRLQDRPCCTPPHKECLEHHGHKGDPGETPGTCGADGENAQVILVWVRTAGVGNIFHQRGLRVMRVRLWAKPSLWYEDFRVLKNTSHCPRIAPWNNSGLGMAFRTT